jgi:hypothetical protein
MARHCFLPVLLGLLGCPADTPQPVLSPVQIDPVRVVEEIITGKRPAIIDGSRYMTVDRFLRPNNSQQSLKEGEWICIEGKVLRTGDRFGATYIHLSSPGSQEYVEFEALGNVLQGTTPGMNVVLRGQTTSHNLHLSNASFVTQQQIDNALKANK